MKIYFGTRNWGWIMYGIGYKSLWFVGFSMNARKGLSSPKTAMVELLVTDIEMYVKAEFCGKRLSEACRKTLEELE